MTDSAPLFDSPHSPFLEPPAPFERAELRCLIALVICCGSPSSRSSTCTSTRPRSRTILMMAAPTTATPSGLDTFMSLPPPGTPTPHHSEGCRDGVLV